MQCTGAAFRVSSDLMPLRLGRLLSPGHCVFTESYATVFALQLSDIILNFEVIFKTSDKITRTVQTVSYTISPASPKKTLHVHGMVTKTEEVNIGITTYLRF